MAKVKTKHDSDTGEEILLVRVAKEGDFAAFEKSVGRNAALVIRVHEDQNLEALGERAKRTCRRAAANAPEDHSEICQIRNLCEREPRSIRPHVQDQEQNSLGVVMAQAVSNQRSVFNLEQVFRGRPSPHLAGMDRSEIIPGKLRHLLESGYSVGSPALQTATDEPQLDLDRYHVVMIPRDVGSGRMTGIAATDGPLFLNWKELVSRVRMELDGEASPQISKSNVVAFGDIQVDLLSIEVRRSKRLVRLSAMEFKVLKYFLSNPDRVVSRDELLNEVWGYNNYPCTRTVDNHVLRLRHKLEPNFSNPIYLRTAAGFGYRFTPEGCVDREVTRHDPYRIKARKRGNRRSPLRASQ